MKDIRMFKENTTNVSIYLSKGQTDTRKQIIIYFNQKGQQGKTSKSIIPREENPSEKTAM